MEDNPQLQPGPASGQRPLVHSIERTVGERGGTWKWILLGCGGALVLACVCLVAAVVTFAVLESRSATPTPFVAGRQQPTPTAGAAARRPTPSPPSLSADWQWFDDPSGQVSLAVPPGWSYFWESAACCNVTVVSFDPGRLPSGRIAWGPPGSAAEHVVPPGQVVLDLFLIGSPFSPERPSFGRAPDGEDLVGGRYRAELYYGATSGDWPRNQALTYLYEDDRGRQWCIVVYFGTPFDEEPEKLATVTAIISSVQHGG